jgi:Heparinase II/III-like protein/Alginate lyase
MPLDFQQESIPGMLSNEHGLIRRLLVGMTTAVAALIAVEAHAAKADEDQAIYNSILPANIASGIGTSLSKVEVFGTPRLVHGHPNTLWDQDDIDHYKEMLKTSRELQLQFSELRSRMDERIGKPLDIPAPQQGPDGAWLYPGEYFPPFPGAPAGEDVVSRFRRYLYRDGEAISDLGTMYVLTGDEKYARYAKDLLLAYSNCSRYGPSKFLYYRSNFGLSGTLLDEAIVLEKLARGYDLVYTSPALSAEDRVRIHDELLRPLASEMIYPGLPDIDPTGSFARQINNRGAIGGTAVLLAGYATDDQELVNAALYGIRSNLTKPDPVHLRQFPPPHDWTAATADHPSNGLLTVHFAPPAIPGGAWVEGSPSYVFYALCSMVNAAEAAWRHGLDLYRYNDHIFKSMFDYPILLSYPDMTTPAENSSNRQSLFNGYVPTLYEYAYRRYRDPRYIAIINSPPERAYLASLNASPTRPKGRSSRSLSMTRAGSAPPSVLYDLNPNELPGPMKLPSVNFPAVGFGVLRTAAPAGKGIQNLTLSYGPSSSQGHPDKLHIDLFSFGDVLMPSPGVNYPYSNNPLIDTWYHTTLAHNTLAVDEASQKFHPHNPREPDVRADQTVFGPAESIGVQRAWSDSAYPGVTMDRALFLTSRYLADLFGGVSDSPHKYDLAWHIRGSPSLSLNLSPSPFRDPVPNGYNVLTDVKASEPTANAWSATMVQGDHSARLLAAGGVPTQAIIGEGGVYVDYTSNVPNKRPTAPTLIERRDNVRSTIFGNVLDLSGEGYVKSVTQEGGIDTGFGLLSIETANGADLCFASYRPGRHTAGGLETDALQALVQMDGSHPHAVYLGGGTVLKFADLSLERSEAGLAYVEKASDGGYIVGNPSPAPATITVKFAALDGLDAFDLDDQGRPTGKVDVKAVTTDGITIHLNASTRIEFVRSKGSKTGP